MESPLQHLRTPVWATVTAVPSPAVCTARDETAPPSGPTVPAAVASMTSVASPLPRGPPRGERQATAAEGFRVHFGRRDAAGRRGQHTPGAAHEEAATYPRGEYGRARQPSSRSRPASAFGDAGASASLRTTAGLRSNSCTSRTPPSATLPQGFSFAQSPAPPAGGNSRRCEACLSPSPSPVRSQSLHRGGGAVPVDLAGNRLPSASRGPLSVPQPTVLPSQSQASPAAAFGSQVVPLHNDFTCGVERTMLPHLAIPGLDACCTPAFVRREKAKASRRETSPAKGTRAAHAGRPVHAPALAVCSRGTEPRMSAYASPQKWDAAQEELAQGRGGGQASARHASVPRSVTTAGRGTSLSSSATEPQTQAQLILQTPSSPATPAASGHTPEEDALRALQLQQQRDLSQALMEGPNARRAAASPDLAWVDGRLPQQQAPREEAFALPPPAAFSPAFASRPPASPRAAESGLHDHRATEKKEAATSPVQSPETSPLVRQQILFFQRQAEMFRLKYEDAERRCAEAAAEVAARDHRIHLLQAPVASLADQLATGQQRAASSLERDGQARDADDERTPEAEESTVLVSKAFHEAQLALARQETKKLHEKIAALQKDLQHVAAAPLEAPSSVSPLQAPPTEQCDDRAAGVQVDQAVRASLLQLENNERKKENAELAARNRELEERLQTANVANAALTEELLQTRLRVPQLHSASTPSLSSSVATPPTTRGEAEATLTRRRQRASTVCLPADERAAGDFASSLHSSASSSRRATSLTARAAAESRRLHGGESCGGGQESLFLSSADLAGDEEDGGRRALALRRELALRKRLNAQRKRRCAELEQQVNLLASSLDAALEQARRAEDAGESLSKQLKAREQESQASLSRGAEAEKMLLAAEARLEASERLVATLREQRRDYKTLHAHHTACLEENRLLRAEIERLENERIQLLAESEKKRTAFLSLLADKERSDRQAQEALDRLSRMQQQQEKGMRELETHALDVEKRLEEKDEEVRSLHAKLEAAVVRAQAAERECVHLRNSFSQPRGEAGTWRRRDDAGSTVAGTEEQSQAASAEQRLELVLLLAEAAQEALRASRERESRLDAEVTAVGRQLDRALERMEKAAEASETSLAQHEAAGALYVQPAYQAGEMLFRTSHQLLDLMQNRANWADLARNLELRELELEARLLAAHQQNDGLHDQAIQLEARLQKSERRALRFAAQFVALLERQDEEVPRGAAEKGEAADKPSDVAEQSEGEQASWRLRSAALERRLEEERVAFAQRLAQETARATAQRNEASRLEQRIQDLLQAGDSLAAEHARTEQANAALAEEVAMLRGALEDVAPRQRAAEQETARLRGELERASCPSGAAAVAAASAHQPAPSPTPTPPGVGAPRRTEDASEHVLAQLGEVTKERDSLRGLCIQLAQHLRRMTEGIARERQEWLARREAEEAGKALLRGDSAAGAQQRGGGEEDARAREELKKEIADFEARWRKAVAGCEALTQQKAELETRLQDLAENCAAAEATCRDWEKRWRQAERARRALAAEAATPAETRRSPQGATTSPRQAAESEDDWSPFLKHAEASLSSLASSFSQLGGVEEKRRSRARRRRGSVRETAEERHEGLQRELETAMRQKGDAENMCRELGGQIRVLTNFLQVAATEKRELRGALEATQAELARASEAADAAASARRGAEEKLKDAEAQLRALEGEHQHAEERAKATEASLAEAARALRFEKEQTALLEQRLASDARDRADRQTRLREEARTRGESAGEETRRDAEARARISANFVRTQDELQAARQKLHHLEAAVAALEAEKRQASARVAAAARARKEEQGAESRAQREKEESLCMAEEELEGLRLELTNAQTRVRALTTEAEAAMAREEELRQEQTQLRRRVRDLEGAVDYHQRERERLCEEISDWEERGQEHAMAMKEFEGSYTAVNVNLGRVQQQLSDLRYQIQAEKARRVSVLRERRRARLEAEESKKAASARREGTAARELQRENGDVPATLRGDEATSEGRDGGADSSQPDRALTTVARAAAETEAEAEAEAAGGDGFAEGEYLPEEDNEILVARVEELEELQAALVKERELLKSHLQATTEKLEEQCRYTSELRLRCGELADALEQARDGKPLPPETDTRRARSFPSASSDVVRPNINEGWEECTEVLQSRLEDLHGLPLRERAQRASLGEEESRALRAQLAELQAALEAERAERATLVAAQEAARKTETDAFAEKLAQARKEIEAKAEVHISEIQDFYEKLQMSMETSHCKAENNLIAQNEALRNELRALQAADAQAPTALAAAQSRVEDLTRQLEIAQVDLERAREAIAQLAGEREAAAKQEATHSEELAKARQEIEATADAHIAEIQDYYDKLQRHMTDAHAKAERDWTAKTAALAKQKTALEAQLSALRDQLAATQGAGDVAGDEETRAEETAAEEREREREAAEFHEAQQASARVESPSPASPRFSMSSSFSSVQEFASEGCPLEAIAEEPASVALRAELTELGAQCDALRARVADLEAALSEQRERLSQRDAENGDLAEQLKQTVAHVKDQADRLARTAQQCSLKDNEIAEMHRRETEFRRQLDELHAKQDDLNSRLVQQNQEAHEALLAKNAAEQRLLLHADSLASEERRRKSAEAHGEELLERLQAAQQKLLECEKEKAHISLSEGRRCEELERLCAERERESAREREEAQAREALQRKRLEALESERREEASRAAELRQRLEEKATQARHHEEQRAALARELEEHRERLAAQARALEAQREARERAQKEFEATLEAQEARHRQFVQERLEEERARAAEDVQLLQRLLDEKRVEQRQAEAHFRRQLETQMQAAKQLDASLQECEDEEEEREERHRATARQLQALHEQYSATLAELTAAVSEREHLREKIEGLENEVAEIRRGAREIQAAHWEQADRERRELEDAETRRAALEEELERVTAEREREARAAEEWRTRLEAESEKTREDLLASLQRQIDAVRAQEEEARARERKEWEASWREQQTQAEERERQVRTCEKRIEELDAEMKLREEAAEKKAEEREKERERRCREYESEIHDLHLRLHQRRIEEEEKLQEIREKQRDLESQLFSMEQTLQVEQRRLAEAKTATEAADAARLQSERLLEEARETAKAAEAKQKELAEQVKKLERESEEKTQRLQEQQIEFSREMALAAEQKASEKAREDTAHLLRDELERTREELLEEKLEVSKLRKELVETTAARADAAERQGLAEKARDEISLQVARLCAEVEELQHTLQDLQTQLADAQSRLSSEQTRADAAEAKQLELEACLRDAEAKARDAQAAEAEERRKEREKVEAARAEMLEELRRREQERDSMLDEINEREEDRRQMAEELQQRAEEIARLHEACRRQEEATRSEMEATLSEQDTLRGELRTLAKHLDEAEAQKRHLNLEADELHCVAETLRQEKARAEADFAQLQAQCRAEESSHASQREFWEKLVEDSQRRQRELQELLLARDAARQSAESEWRSKLDSAQVAFASLEEKLRSREAVIASLQTQLAETRESMSRSCSMATAEFQAKESRYEAKIAQLQEESQSIKRAVESALADCRRQAEEHEQMLRETLGETQNHAQSLQRQLELSRAELTGRERAWATAEQQSREEASRLRSRCSALEMELRMQETRLKGLEQDNKALQSREETTRQSLQEALQRETEMQRRFQQTWNEAHLSTEELLLELQRDEQKNRLELRLAEQRLQELQQMREREVTDWARERTRLQAESEKRQRDATDLAKQLAEAQLAEALAKEEVCRAQDEIAVLRVKEETLQRQFLMAASSSNAAASGAVLLGVSAAHARAAAPRDAGASDELHAEGAEAFASVRALAERRCRALEAALKTASDSRDRNAQHCASLRRELAETSRELQREREESERKASELERAKARIEKLLAMQEETRAQASELHRRCREYREKVEEMMTEKQREEEDEGDDAQRHMGGSRGRGGVVLRLDGDDDAAAAGRECGATSRRENERARARAENAGDATLSDSRGSALARQALAFQRQTEMLQTVIEELGQKLATQQEQGRLLLLTHGHREQDREKEEVERQRQSLMQLLEQKCEEGEIERAALKAELQRAEFAYLDFQAQKDEAEKEARRLEIVSQNLQLRLERLEADREGLQASDRQREGEAEQREQQLLEALQEREIQQRVQESYLERIRSVVEELKAALKQTRREKDASEHRVTLLRQQIEESRVAQRDRESALSLLEREAEETRERLEKLDVELQTERRKRQKVELQKDDMEKTFGLDRAALEEECHALQGSLESLRERLQAHEETKRLLETEARKWARQCQELQAALGAGRETAEARERERGAERRKWRAEIEDERRAALRLEQRVAELEKERQREQEERERERSRTREEDERLKARMAESRSAWEERCAELSGDLTEVRKQWRDTQVRLEKALRAEEDESRKRQQAERERDEEMRRAEAALAALEALQSAREEADAARPAEGASRKAERQSGEPGEESANVVIPPRRGDRRAHEPDGEDERAAARLAASLSASRGVAALEEEIAALRKSLEAAADTRDLLDDECARLRREAAVANGELDAARTRGLRVEEEMRALSEDLKDCRRALRDAENERAIHAEAVAQLERGLERAQREREERLDRLVALENEVRRLHREKEESAHRLRTAEQARESLSRSLQVLRSRERSASERAEDDEVEKERRAREAWREEKAQTLAYLQTLDAQLRETELAVADIREDRDRVQRALLEAQTKLADALKAQRDAREASEAQAEETRQLQAAGMALSRREAAAARRLAPSVLVAVDAELREAQWIAGQARERVDALERELTASYKQRDADSARVALLRTQLATQRKAIEDADVERERLATRLEECGRAEEFAAVALEAERKLNVQLKEQRVQMEAELAETARRRMQSESDAREVHSRLRETEHLLHQARSQLQERVEREDALREEMERKEQEVAELKAAQDEPLQRVERLERELQAAEARLLEDKEASRRTAKELRKRDALIRQLEAEKEDIGQRERDAIAREAESARERAQREFLQALAERERRIHRLEDELRTALRQLEESHAQAERARVADESEEKQRQEARRLQRELEKQKELAQALENERQGLTQEKKENAERIAVFQDEVNRLKEVLNAERGRARAQLEKERQRAAGRERQEDEALRRHREEAEALKRENQALKSSLETQSARLQEVERRTRDRDAESEGLARELRALQAEVARLKAVHDEELGALNADLESVRTRLRESDAAREGAEALSTDLQAQLAAVEARFRAAEANLERYERGVQKLKLREKDARDRVAQARAALEGLLALPSMLGASSAALSLSPRAKDRQNEALARGDLAALAEELRAQRREEATALREREEERRRAHRDLTNQLEEERTQVEQLQELLRHVNAARKEALEQEKAQTRELERLRSALAKADASGEERRRAQLRLEDGLEREKRRRRELAAELRRQQSAAAIQLQDQDAARRRADEQEATERALKERDDECAALQEALLRLRGEAAELREEKNALERRSGALSAKLGDIEDEKAKLVRELSSGAKERRELDRKTLATEARVSDLQAECFRLQRQLEEVVEQHALARSLTGNADEEKRRLEETLKETVERAETAEGAARDLERALRELRRETKRLEDEIALKQMAESQLKQTVAALQAEAVAREREVEATVLTGVEERREANAAARAAEELAGLRSQLEDRERELSRLRARLREPSAHSHPESDREDWAAMEAQLVRTQEEKAKLEEARRLLEQEARARDERSAHEREQLIKENLELNERVAYLQNRSRILEDDLAALQRASAALEASLEAAREDAQRRASEEAAARPAAAELAKELELAERARERLEREEARLAAELKESRQALFAQEKRQEDQDQELEALREQVGEVRQVLQKKEEELALALARLTGKESELACAEKDVKELQEAARSAQEHLARLEKTKEELRAKNAMLQTQVERRVREMEGMKRELEAVRQGQAAQGDDDSDNTRGREKEDALAAELRHVEALCEELQNAKQEAEVLLAHKTREIEDFRREAGNEARALRQDAARLRAMHAELVAQCEETQQAVRVMKTRIRELERENRLLQRALFRAEEECNALKSREERLSGEAQVPGRRRARDGEASDLGDDNPAGADVQAEGERHRQLVASLRQRVADLELQMQKAENEERELKAELQGATRRANELQHALEQGVEKYDDLVVSKEDLKRRLAEERQTWEEQRRREAENQQKEVALLREESMALEKENRVFQQELDRQAGDLKALHEKTLRLSDRNARLQAELAKEKDAASAVAPLEKEISELQEELKMQEDASRDTEADLEVYRLKTRELEAEVATLWQQIEDERGERERLHSDNLVLASHQNPEQKLKYTEILKKQLLAERAARLRVQRDVNRLRVEAFSLRPLLRLLAGEPLDARAGDSLKGAEEKDRNALQASIRALSGNVLASSLALGASQASTALLGSRRITRLSRPGLRHARSVSASRRVHPPTAARSLSLSCRSEKKSSLEVSARGRLGGDAFPVYRQLRILHRSLNFVMKEFMLLLALLQDALKDQHLLERLFGILPVSSTFLVSDLPLSSASAKAQDTLSRPDDPPGLSLSQLDEDQPPESLEARRRDFFAVVCDLKLRLRAKLLSESPAPLPAALPPPPPSSSAHGPSAPRAPSAAAPHEVRPAGAVPSGLAPQPMASPPSSSAVRQSPPRRRELRPASLESEGLRQPPPLLSSLSVPGSLSLSPSSDASPTLASRRELRSLHTPHSAEPWGQVSPSPPPASTPPPAPTGRGGDDAGDARGDEGARVLSGRDASASQRGDRKALRMWCPQPSFSLSPSLTPEGLQSDRESSSRAEGMEPQDSQRCSGAEQRASQTLAVDAAGAPSADMEREKEGEGRANGRAAKKSVSSSFFSSFASISSFFESRIE